MLGASILDVRKETGISAGGAKWYLCHLKESLKPSDALKKGQD